MAYSGLYSDKYAYKMNLWALIYKVGNHCQSRIKCSFPFEETVRTSRLQNLTHAHPRPQCNKGDKQMVLLHSHLSHPLNIFHACISESTFKGSSLCPPHFVTKQIFGKIWRWNMKLPRERERDFTEGGGLMLIGGRRVGRLRQKQ